MPSGDGRKVGWEGMRTHKYRAWDTDNLMMYYSDREYDDGEWGKKWIIEGDEIYFMEMKLSDTNPGCMGHVQEEIWHRPNQIVMQFTGLLDCKGKEIYEGDILRWNVDGTYTSVSEIKWSDSEQGFRPRVNNTTEVIGNIYEHKNLLDNSGDL